MFGSANFVFRWRRPLAGLMSLAVLATTAHPLMLKYKFSHQQRIVSHSDTVYPGNKFRKVKSNRVPHDTRSTMPDLKRELQFRDCDVELAFNYLPSHLTRCSDVETPPPRPARA